MSAAKIISLLLYFADIHAKGAFLFLPILTSITATVVMLALTTFKIICEDANLPDEEEEEWYVYI